MSEPLRYVLCLGSNTPDCREIIPRAVEALACLCHIEIESALYESPDESGLGAPYLNQVVAVTPRLGYGELCARLKALEIEFGRNDRSKAAGIMPLDVDVIIWDYEVVDPYQFSRRYFRIGYNAISCGGKSDSPE